MVAVYLFFILNAYFVKNSQLHCNFLMTVIETIMGFVLSAIIEKKSVI